MHATHAILSLLFCGLTLGSLRADLVLQPGPGANDGTDDGDASRGMDAATWDDPGVRVANGGTNERMLLLNSPCNFGLLPAYLQFRVADLPARDVTRARIEVYCRVEFNGAGWPWQVSPQLSLRRVTQPWNEMTVTAQTLPATEEVVLGTHTIPTVGGGSSGQPFTEFEGWLTFDITSTYLGWVSGAFPNHGVEFRIDNTYCANGDILYLYASDHADPNLRPRLVIEASASTPTARFPLQPGPGANNGTDDGTGGGGVDAATWNSATGSVSNGGAEERMLLLNSPCNFGLLPAYLQFNLAGLPTENLTNAQLKVYCRVEFNGAGWPWPVSPQISLRRVTQPWGEMTVTAQSLPATEAAPLGTHTIPVVGGGSSGQPFTEFEGWLTFDLTSTYLGWVSGAFPNHGVEFRIDNTYCGNGDIVYVYASDHPDAALRPTLSVQTAGAPLTSSLTPAANEVSLSWTTAAGATYRILASPNLANWADVGLSIVGQGGPTNVVLPNVGTNQAVFYLIEN